MFCCAAAGAAALSFALAIPPADAQPLAQTSTVQPSTSAAAFALHPLVARFTDGWNAGDAAAIEAMRRSRRNAAYLPDGELPATLALTGSEREPVLVRQDTGFLAPQSRLHGFARLQREGDLDVGEGMEALILACLAKDADDRPSAEEEVNGLDIPEMGVHGYFGDESYVPGTPSPAKMPSKSAPS